MEFISSIINAIFHDVVHSTNQIFFTGIEVYEVSHLHNKLGPFMTICCTCHKHCCFATALLAVLDFFPPVLSVAFDVLLPASITTMDY